MKKITIKLIHVFSGEFQVVHMTMNPADEAADNYKNEMDKLRAEVIEAPLCQSNFSNLFSRWLIFYACLI